MKKLCPKTYYTMDNILHLCNVISFPNVSFYLGSRMECYSDGKYIGKITGLYGTYLTVEDKESGLKLKMNLIKNKEQ